jgi:hypothetical protein
MIQRGDVMIRSVPGDEFLVVNAVTFKTLEGPFTTFADALATARLFVAPGHSYCRFASYEHRCSFLTARDGRLL